MNSVSHWSVAIAREWSLPKLNSYMIFVCGENQRSITEVSLLMFQSAVGIYMNLLDLVGKYDKFDSRWCAATCSPLRWIDTNDNMIFKSHFSCNSQMKDFYDINPNTWCWKSVSSLFKVLQIILLTNCNTKHCFTASLSDVFCFILCSCTGVKCLCTLTWLLSVLLQYCGQPGVLVHHSHRGAVQQSKWKHQAGHQGQGGCMTETLDFIIFMLMNRKTLFLVRLIYGVF